MTKNCPEMIPVEVNLAQLFTAERNNTDINNTYFLEAEYKQENQIRPLTSIFSIDELGSNPITLDNTFTKIISSKGSRSI